MLRQAVASDKGSPTPRGWGSSLKPQYRGNPNKLWGHCYVASEVAYHLKYKELGFKPHVIKTNGITHWFLKNINTKEILDLTSEQFDKPIDYNNGKCCGFLTKNPSKRSKTLMERL